MTSAVLPKGVIDMKETESGFHPTLSEESAADAKSALAAGVLDQVEAARVLHVKPRTLESWRQRRTGPRFIRYSQRCVRYRPRDLQAWIDARTVETFGAE
jgi:hypothetical protein